MSKILLRIAFLLLPLTSVAQSPDSLRVLWIGNSFTYYNNMPSTVRDIAAARGIKISCTRFTRGGEKFAGHLCNQALLDTIAAGGWDYVVLQEQSSAPAMHTAQVARNVYPSAHRLDSLVHAASPHVKVVFYMTWGHKNGNRVPVPGYPLIDSYEGMQERLETSYLEMAYDNHAWCAPVGMAWRRVRAEHPSLELYAPDSYHPSAEGSYLAACVIFTAMFGEPLPASCYAGLSPEVAGYLQNIARLTVLENRTLCNIDPCGE